jgi:hypothetical protein
MLQGYSRPMGDQFGPLLAGACSLVSSGEITLEQARKFVDKRFNLPWATNSESLIPMSSP